MPDIGMNKKLFRKVVDLRQEAELQRGIGDTIKNVTAAWAITHERNRQAEQAAGLANRLGVGGEAFTPDQMVGVNPGVLLSGLINQQLAKGAQEAYYDRAIGVEHMRNLGEQAERDAIPKARVQTPFGVFEVPIKSPSDLKTATELGTPKPGMTPYQQAMVDLAREREKRLAAGKSGTSAGGGAIAGTPGFGISTDQDRLLNEARARIDMAKDDAFDLETRLYGAIDSYTGERRGGEKDPQKRAALEQQLQQVRDQINQLNQDYQFRWDAIMSGDPTPYTSSDDEIPPEVRASMGLDGGTSGGSVRGSGPGGEPMPMAEPETPQFADDAARGVRLTSLDIDELRRIVQVRPDMRGLIEERLEAAGYMPEQILGD